MIRQLIFTALLGLTLGAPNPKIDGPLQQIFNSGALANIVVSFEDTDAVLQRVDTMKFSNRAVKITALKAHLEELAADTQRSALQHLHSRKISFQSFWVNNKIYINDADIHLAQELAALNEVLNIRQEIIAHIDEPIPARNNSILAEWGIEKIGATSAWALPGGNNGQGVLVSSIDTGVRYTHEALKNNFVGEYGWYDPYLRTLEPEDANGHGTHTMGTIAGAGGIGVAPGAQWMTCRGCYPGSCAEMSLVGCGQFLVCPTLANGQSPDCSKSPDVVSNSWGSYGGATWYSSVINAWHSAGIIPHFSIGNSGSSCNTANAPGDIYNVIGVGATDINDGITSYSSRGPTFREIVKPDVSAPGDDVRSAWNGGDDDYNTISGTSMACPHVAGTTALLLSRNPNLTYDQIKDLLQDNAERDLGDAASCGDTGVGDVPNNIYGYGRINAQKSLASAISGY